MRQSITGPGSTCPRDQTPTPWEPYVGPLDGSKLSRRVDRGPGGKQVVMACCFLGLTRQCSSSMRVGLGKAPSAVEINETAAAFLVGTSSSC